MPMGATAAYAADNENIPKPTQVGGHGDEYDGIAYMDVFQKFESNVRGDVRTMHYELHAGGVKGAEHDMAYPVDETPMPPTSQDGVFPFTLTDNEERSIPVDMSDAKPGVYEYHLICVEPEREGYTYMNAAGSTETTYVTRIYVSAEGETTTQFCYPDGRKVYDPGWTIKHVADEEKQKEKDGDLAPKLGQVAVPLALLLIPALGIIIVSGRKRKEEEE